MLTSISERQFCISAPVGQIKGKEDALKIHNMIMTLLNDPSLSKGEVLELANKVLVLCNSHNILDRRIDSAKLEWNIENEPVEDAFLLMDLSKALYEHKISLFFTLYQSLSTKELFQAHCERRNASIELLNEPEISTRFEENIEALIESCFRCAFHLTRGKDFGIYPSQKFIIETLTHKFS